MDSFLTKLYDEGRTKQAGADMEHYLADLPVEELFKIAVGGPPLPELPDSAAGSRLDRKQKFIAEYVNKAHLSEVPDRKASGVVGKVNFDGEGKEPESNVDDALRFSGSKGQTKKASVGGLFKKIAPSVLGKEAGVQKALRFAESLAKKNIPVSASRNLPIFQKLRARVDRYHSGPAVYKQTRGAAEAQKGFRKLEKSLAHLEPSKTAGLTKECSATAQEKAKIAMRAINVTRGASPQIKMAAAVFAGRSIAALGK